MKKKGVTLIELVVTLALVGIVSLIVYSSFSRTNIFFSQVSGKIDVQQEADIITRRISSDITNATSLTSDISDSMLVVEKEGNIKHTYALSGSILKVNDSDVIGNNIKAITFKSTGGRTVQIDFTIETNKLHRDFNSVLTIRNWRN